MRTVKELIVELQEIEAAGGGDMPILFTSTTSDDAYDIDAISKQTDPEDGKEYYCIE